jgi:hypothetical protein
MIRPPVTAWRIGRQEHPQALPLLISQIMTIQLIKHHTDLHDPAAKIHGTRSKGASPQPGEPCLRAGLSEKGSGRIDAVARCAPVWTACWR